MMMPRSRGMEMQIEIARDREEIVKLFQLVDAPLARPRSRDRRPRFRSADIVRGYKIDVFCSGRRLGGIFVYAFVHFS